jgi:uncharacterized membrane protein YfcA
LELALLAALAFFAGFVDAVVGGGGLVQIPGLFTLYPQAAPGMLFGTNKVASICGTAAATLRYARGVKLRWPMLIPASLGALVFSFLGARIVTLLPVEIIRPVVLVLLIAVAIYTFHKKHLGAVHVPRLKGAPEKWLGFAAGAVLGFYDGFFGPGTGMFLIFVFVRLFGYDFLNASASAKVINVITNLAALLYFLPSGNVLWQAAAVMAVSQVLGSVSGTHLALRHGAVFVRRLFLAVLGAIILKFGYDTLKLLTL